tara:strand:- start:708 stop:953 length:246 start_codon:yes stop_codon:yes gene_type:complete
MTDINKRYPMREHRATIRRKRREAEKRRKANLPSLIEEYKGIIAMVREMRNLPEYAEKRENLNRILDTFSEGLRKLKEELQ